MLSTVMAVFTIICLVSYINLMGESMKTKIGIVGYGNLGKQVERQVIESRDCKLVAIFSRREDAKSQFGSKIEKYENYINYINKIDIMLMCGSSQKDLQWQSPQMLEHFDIIDTFDIHSKINTHKTNLENVSKKSGKTAIYSCGWDPGLFSIIRVLNNAMLKNPKVYTFWGKGVSQGHSVALRQVEGVEDAIEYTIPNAEQIQKARTDYNFELINNTMHTRECFVAVKQGYQKQDIEQKILNTENYFKGQNVKIHFVKKQLIEKLKKRMYHAGQILGMGKDKNAQMRFYVKMKSNPQFTANIMIAYINALQNLPAGVYSVLDVAPKYLLKNSQELL